MQNIIDINSIRFGYAATDWREAVNESGKLLVAAGKVEPQYIDAMIEMVEQHGAYMIVAPGVAMPHARAEQGVKETGISFLSLQEPITFPLKEQNPVSLLIGVAAIDSSQHLDAFGRIAALIANETEVKELITCTDVMKIFTLLNT